MAPGVLSARRRRPDGALATTIRLDPGVLSRVSRFLDRHGGTLSAAVNYVLRRKLLPHTLPRP